MLAGGSNIWEINCPGSFKGVLNMETILSVAIPTFNRVDKLKKCLESLLAEIAGKPVELLVSDNASQDGTQAYMEEICREHPEVTYIRNSENVGPDRNFLNCYNRASGEYVYLLGDDDVLLPGAMDAILETLAKKPVILDRKSVVRERVWQYV
jgi:glycosyltransferase involved in cell wall biosynthesis